MPIVLIIFGVLLLLFGGGCTLIMLGVMIDDPSHIWSNLQDVAPFWIPLGLLPLVIGGLLVRGGLKWRRAKQAQPVDRVDPPG
jgi:hypothetical protein